MTNNGNLILNVENISYIRYNENVEFQRSGKVYLNSNGLQPKHKFKCIL